MPRIGRLLAMLAGVALTTGCTLGTQEDNPVDPHAGSMGGATRPAVIAVLDSGVNPYHEAFQAGPDTPALPPEVVSTPISLSAHGDYAERLEMDAPTWNGLETKRLYSFVGTRVLAISMAHRDGSPPILDTQADSWHGTGTAAMALRDAPHVWIVMVQAPIPACNPTSSDLNCMANSFGADAMEWAADQPWIDVISSSLAWTVNLPRPSDMNPDAKRWLDASERAAASGKLVLNAAGNFLTAPLPAHQNGPPWVIAVGGAHPDSRGEALYASRGVDVAGNYSEKVPAGDSVSDYRLEFGTSFATPVVASALGEAIYLARERAGGADGKLAAGPRGEADAHAFREALNRTATRFDTAGWNPGAIPHDNIPDTVTSSSIPALAPGQMGWGYIDAAMAQTIALRALGEEPLPTPDPAVAIAQASLQSAREAYWATLR